MKDQPVDRADGLTVADRPAAGTVSTFVRVVAAVALLGNVATMVLGVNMATTGSDAFGFSKVYGIGVVIAGILTLAPGLLLWRAAGALGDGGSGLVPASPRRRALSTAGTVIVAFVWLLPIVATLRSNSGPQIAMIGLLFGLVGATAAWTARYFGGHRRGRQLIMVALLAAAPG